MNLNTSRQKRPESSPVRYNLERPKGLPPVFVPSWGMLLNGVIAVGALGAASLGIVIVGSGEKLPDVENILKESHQQDARSGGEQSFASSQGADPKTLQSTLEDSLKQYDALRSQKQFPEKLVEKDYRYYTAYPISLTREESKKQFLERYKNTTYLGFYTKLDNVVFLRDRAYVQTTTKIRTKAPVRTYVSAFHEGAERTASSQALTDAVRYVRTGGVWKHTEGEAGEDNWQVLSEQPISLQGPYVKGESDAVTYGENWPEALSAPAELIGSRLAALDSARSSGDGDYGKNLLFSSFQLDVEGDGDGKGNLSRPTAEWRFKKAVSAFDSLEVKTEIKQAVQTSSFEIIALVERRYTWHNPKNGATVTAAREEADFWTQGQGTFEYYLLRTENLGQSPVLTYAGL